MFNFGKRQIVFQSVYTDLHPPARIQVPNALAVVRIFNLGHLVDVE